MVGAAVGFLLFLYLARSQSMVDDQAYKKAIISHHSIAVLTSRRAKITDPRVRELADTIFEAQVRERGQIELLLEDIEANAEMGGDTPLKPRTAELTPSLRAKTEAAIAR